MEELSFEKVKNLIPGRLPDSHKGSFGTLFAVCGSAYYRGAAALACEAALRCGAGIVRLASTEKVCAAVASSRGHLPSACGREGRRNKRLFGFRRVRALPEYHRRALRMRADRYSGHAGHSFRSHRKRALYPRPRRRRAKLHKGRAGRPARGPEDARDHSPLGRVRAALRHKGR